LKSWKDELEHYETMMGRQRGPNWQWTLDRLTNAMV